MQRHEFWLNDHEWSGKYGPPAPGEDRTIYRITLGDLIPAIERKTFPIRAGRDLWNKSGSIGFMDLTISEEWPPKEGAIPLPNPNHSPYGEFCYDSRNLQRARVLVIQYTGIEPQYRRRGYAGQLRLRAEEIAREWGLDTIVGDLIENPDSRRAMVNLGYQLYDNGLRAVKRLRYLPAHPS